jgi:glycosyltransferase involved in cell wall biosynthesis
MKILTGIDIPFVPFGGSPIICNDWYSNLPPDVEVKFLTLKPNLPEYNNWWSMKDVVLMNIEKKKSIEDFPEYIKKLKTEVSKYINDFKPDIIHCQHLNFGLSRAFAELSDEYKIPRIGICHGTDVQMAIKSKFFLDNMKYIRSKMNLLHFPAQKMADDYFKVDKCKKEYVVISHGISDDAYIKRNNKIKLENGPLKILYAGRLTSFKGSDIAVSAMKYIQENVNLTIIGGEDEVGYKQKMVDEVNKNNLQDKVNFIDHLPQRELWKRFDDYHIIVFPSTVLEAFSLTTIEAQARGLMVVYAGAGGIENAVGESGIKVNENTPGCWANTIKNIFYNTEIIEKYQKLGYKNAEKFRLSNIKKEFFDISRNLINQ